VLRAAPCRNVPVTFTLDRRMRALADRLLSARCKGWLRSGPVFEPYASVSPADIAALELRVGRAIPESLRSWLELVGFGDIDEALSFRAEWVQPVEFGRLKGGFRFAQDDGGNFYACAPSGDSVAFFPRSEPAYAMLSASFREFLEELEKRDYKVIEWTDSVERMPYEWAAV